MPRIEGEIMINRRVEDVFDFVSDACNEPRYNPQMVFVEQVSIGPVGLGTQFRAELRSGGRSVPMLIEFTAFERPVRLGSRATLSGMVTDGAASSFRGRPPLRPLPRCRQDCQGSRRMIVARNGAASISCKGA